MLFDSYKKYKLQNEEVSVVVKDSDRIAKVINQLSRLGVKVTKTKSRLDLFQALQGYKEIRGFVKL
ncbi:MAG: hypothetical protein IMW92_05110 [Bacillales bacterium]|nr:hypothetical protein [Bacillales bacterium]